MGASQALLNSFTDATSAMKPSEALHAHRADIRRVVEQSKIRNPRVFGSVLRGDDNNNSDLDLLVDALPGATLFDLGAVQFELEQLLGVPVDVLTPGDLPVRFRDRILKEAALVCAQRRRRATMTIWITCLRRSVLFTAMWKAFPRMIFLPINEPSKRSF
jgi:uncharacterized protein